jgi:methylsterol monooxygenase
MMMRSHLLSFLVWQILGISSAIHSHSGYHFPFCPSNERHDYHHLKFNSNFGVLGILDDVHRTDRANYSTSYQQGNDVILYQLEPLPVPEQEAAKKKI